MGEVLWTRSYPYRLIEQFGDYALLWGTLGGPKEGGCQLIELATGAVVWELDHPDAYISQVYPYEDKVVIVWFWELGTKGTNRVLCVEVPSGKVLWENDASREYKSTERISWYSSMSIIGRTAMMMKTYTQSWMFILARSILVGIQAIMPMYLSRLSTRTTCSMAQRKLMPMSER